IVVIFLPDNALFVRNYFIEPPTPQLTSIPRDSKGVLDFLATLPGQENVFCANFRLGAYIPVLSHHSSLLGNLPVTPLVNEKIELGNRFLRNRDVELFLNKYHITLIVISKKTQSNFDKSVKRAEWQVVFENATWKIYRISH
ncbi:MAG: hypothetical protein NT106_13735, partial [Candidatus Sumerlaeota bacterium]|nr:hypothetical protein [Candidatus Sumerlaeota bacterium]